MSLFQPMDRVPPWAAAWLGDAASLGVVASLGLGAPAPVDAPGVEGLGDALPPQAPMTRPNATEVANHRLVRGRCAIAISSTSDPPDLGGLSAPVMGIEGVREGVPEQVEGQDRDH